jgi:cysteinyl-tRNA synthetase
VLSLYNTASRQVEPLTVRHAGRVQLFVCGPTVYDASHAGHAKTYTQFDLLARYLARSYRVEYLMNITDVDDKIIQRAAALQTTPAALAARSEEAFWSDMAWIGNSAVTQVAHATDYMPQIIDQIQRLAEIGAAYQTADGWYFDISRASHYGYLSHASPNDATAVTRVETSQKRNPGDFALWKAAKPGEPVWDSPLGAGRPGWHIEDTAITEAIFGPQYDIHGGALDLIFPHHEAELAQMETLSGLHPMVGHWVHTGVLTVDGEKMAKSVGNFTTIATLRERGVEARTLRYMFLTQHYRTSFDLSESRLDQAMAARSRVAAYWQQLGDGAQPDTKSAVAQLRAAFFEAMDDDLNTPVAFARLFEFLREANRTGADHGAPMRAFLTELNDLFEIFDAPQAVALDTKVQALVVERGQLRKARSWAEADTIRQQLTIAGYTLEDTPDGTQVWQGGVLLATV